MPGINSILDMGKWALFGFQSAIEVTGNNIANVNTEGYRRQEVRFEERMALDYAPGQMGLGVSAKEVFRHFNSYIEQQYLEKSSYESRWETIWQNLRSIELVFNEANSEGISELFAKFWEDWQTVSSHPSDTNARAALVGDTHNLMAAMSLANDDLVRLQQQANDFIDQEVTEVNEILREIAEVNDQISLHHVEGENNANQLFDNRDLLLRDLAEKMDISYVDNGGGDFTVFTRSGHTLVTGGKAYEIKFEADKKFSILHKDSNFDGEVYFNGDSDREYMIEFLSNGSVSTGGSAAPFRVSLDGGITWLKDESGNQEVFYARPESQKVVIRDLEIWFGMPDDETAVPSNQIHAGDQFVIVPKEGLYWYENTSSAVNITPQVLGTGQDNQRRLIGGTLAGYFTFRDEYIGKYREKLDTLAEGLVWEVNRLHSQGGGLQKFEDLIGSYSVERDDLVLASNATGLHYGSKLSQGNFSMYFYNSATGELASNASYGSLDFGAAAGVQMFDPDTHTLEDVRDAVNRTFGTFVTATIENHRLRINAADGYEFAFGTDTTGLVAALGMNTFFNGQSTSTLSLNEYVKNNLDFVNASHVNGAGELNPGDNSTAYAIAQLQFKDVRLTTTYEGTTTQTLEEYYNTLPGNIGTDTAGAQFSYEYHKAMAKDLNDRQEEVSGVNLDEEMSSLIRFQHSYTAAAKLIRVADEMLSTLLSLKP